MSEKKPLADELIKEILKLDMDIEGWKNCIHGQEPFGMDKVHLVIWCADEEHPEESEQFANEINEAIEGSFIWDDGNVYVDLYRLAAMGRRWARTVGFTISDMALSNGGGMICIYKNIPEPTDEDIDSYESEQDIGYSPIHSHHKTELSATFAAISAVWERVKNND